jgi:hypothetical protein
MIANPADDPARSRDLTRLRDLTSLHLPYPAAPIGPALAHMTQTTAPRSWPYSAASATCGKTPPTTGRVTASTLSPPQRPR